LLNIAAVGETLPPATLGAKRGMAMIPELFDAFV
jgi:hypothetical protein